MSRLTLYNLVTPEKEVAGKFPKLSTLVTKNTDISFQSLHEVRTLWYLSHSLNSWINRNCDAWNTVVAIVYLDLALTILRVEGPPRDWVTFVLA